jgi:hypothetical protein
LTESTLWAGALSWRIQSMGQSSGLFYVQFHVTASVFPHNKLGWLFGFVDWIQSEPFKMRNKIIPGTSQPHHKHNRSKANLSLCHHNCIVLKYHSIMQFSSWSAH